MSAAAATRRRGWCPGALRPMETGDGWLVRIHPPGGSLSADDLGLLARLAREAGNGLLDTTGRGNLQLRGVTPATHRPLVEALIAGGIADADEGEGPIRPVLASPLAGRDPADLIDAAALAVAVGDAARVIPGLPAKTLVVVDGGGLPLDNIACDLRLLAMSGERLLIDIAGHGWFGPLALPMAVAFTRACLDALASAHRRAPDHVRRLRDLPAEAVAVIAARFSLAALPQPPARRAPVRAGVLPETGGTTAVFAAAPFGRLDAGALDGVAALARHHRAHDIRLTPWRGIAMTGLADPQAALTGLAALGLIVDPADPRLVVQACPGAPACARGEAPAQADAVLFARAAAGRLAEGLSLHVSGCAKGCARPGIADVTLVGQEGAYGVVLAGRASDAPVARLTAAELAVRLAVPGDLAANLLGT